MKVRTYRNPFQGFFAAVVVCSLLIASSVSAKGASSTATRWVILPLVVVGGEGKDAKQYQSTFESEITRSGIERASPKQVSAFLTQEPTCLRKDECLGRLAKAVHADRVLLVTISPFSKEMVLTAKIVGSNGSVINESASTVNRAPNETSLTAAKDAFEVLLSDLQTEPTPLTPPVAEQNPKGTSSQGTTSGQTGSTQTGSTQASSGQTSSTQTGTASAATTTPGTTTSSTQSTTSTQQQNQQVSTSLKSPPPAPAAPSGSWKTPAGIGIGAAGVALVGLGSYFLIQSNHEWDTVNAFHDNKFGVALAKDAEEMATHTKAAESLRTASIAAGVAGAIAIAGGGFLIISDKRQPEDSRPKVSARLAITPNAGALVIQFP